MDRYKIILCHLDSPRPMLYTLFVCNLTKKMYFNEKQNTMDQTDIYFHLLGTSLKSEIRSPIDRAELWRIFDQRYYMYLLQIPVYKVGICVQVPFFMYMYVLGLLCRIKIVTIILHFSLNIVKIVFKKKINKKLIIPTHWYFVWRFKRAIMMKLHFCL